MLFLAGQGRTPFAKILFKLKFNLSSFISLPESLAFTYSGHLPSENGSLLWMTRSLSMLYRFCSGHFALGTGRHGERVQRLGMMLERREETRDRRSCFRHLLARWLCCRGTLHDITKSLRLADGNSLYRAELNRIFIFWKAEK